MMGALLAVGIAAVVAGVLALLYGLSIKEFGFGNTMMIVGTVFVATGMIMFGLWAVLGELRNIARRLAPRTTQETRLRPILPAPGALPGPATAEMTPAETSEQTAAPPAGPEPQPVAMAQPPWREDAGPRDRGRPSQMPAVSPPLEMGPPPRPSRNLMFSSTTRKQRERDRIPRSPDADVSDAPSAAPSNEPAEAPRSGFDAAWPKPDRARPDPARRSRNPSTFPEPPVQGEQGDEKPAVTVVKSGVVDGMAYSLYSDGSIEAQMPEGMMRFGSVDELRSHLDQRA